MAAPIENEPSPIEKTWTGTLQIGDPSKKYHILLTTTPPTSITLYLTDGTTTLHATPSPSIPPTIPLPSIAPLPPAAKLARLHAALDANPPLIQLHEDPSHITVSAIWGVELTHPLPLTIAAIPLSKTATTIPFLRAVFSRISQNRTQINSLHTSCKSVNASIADLQAAHSRITCHKHAFLRALAQRQEQGPE